MITQPTPVPPPPPPVIPAKAGTPPVIPPLIPAKAFPKAYPPDTGARISRPYPNRPPVIPAKAGIHPTRHSGESRNPSRPSFPQ